jgi:hypothetical protein
LRPAAVAAVKTIVTGTELAEGAEVGVGATKALGQVGDGELLAPSSVPARPAVYSSGTLSGAVYGMRVLTPSYS